MQGEKLPESKKDRILSSFGWNKSRFLLIVPVLPTDQAIWNLDYYTDY